MKLTCVWPADGPICIAPLIRRETRSSSCCRQTGIWWQPGFLRLALSAGQTRPRVINVDGHPAYASAIGELKRNGELSRNCRCRRSQYRNNIIEQDHRFVKKRVVASQGFRSVDGALSSIAAYEAMNVICKGQIRWLPKGDVIGQRLFIEGIFGIAA